MDSYQPPPVDYLSPVWPPTRGPREPIVGPADWKDIVPIFMRALWLTRPTDERAESARVFADAAKAWNADLAPPAAAGHSPAMERTEVDAQLEMVSDLITRLVDAAPDDPALMETVASLQVSLEERAGEEHVDHVRERFQCILGSLGLIPSDNEGEACD